MHKATMLVARGVVQIAIALGLLSAGAVQAADERSDSVAASSTSSDRASSLDELKSRAKEIQELAVEGDATLMSGPRPISVEFKESKRVALLVAEDLTRRGLQATAEPGSPTVLRMSARVSFRGPAGRMAFDLGSMFEKVLAGKPAAEQAQLDPAQNLLFGTTSYLRTAGLERIGLFDPFLYRYFSVMAVSDALGIHGGVNKALTGDRRGVCLFNCENWSNTHHWVIVEATVSSDGTEKQARSVLKAWMTEIDPQTTFDIAYQTLLQDRLLKAVP